MSKKAVKVIEAGSVRVVNKSYDHSDITICAFADGLTLPNEMIKKYYDINAIVMIFGDVSVAVDGKSGAMTYYALQDGDERYGKLYVANFGHIMAVATKKKDIIKAVEEHSINGLTVEILVPLKKDTFTDTNSVVTRYITQSAFRAAEVTKKAYGDNELPRVYRYSPKDKN